MGIRTKVTLEEDVLERLKQQSRLTGCSFRDTLNELLRYALLKHKTRSRRHRFQVKPTRMGYRPGLNYDSVESLIEYAEGERHR